MTQPMTIGLIGLDTSHVPAFAKLLNDTSAEFHVPGGKVIAAFPGGSDDFELSYSRVEGFTNQLRDEFGVTILDSPEAVAEACDAVMIESVDGRVHLDLFRRIAPYGKPVFIDKPFAVSSSDAREIVEIAKKHNIPLMSCSSLRYAEGLLAAQSRQDEKGPWFGVDCYGPMALQPTQPGLFWYGIHTVEMLFAVMGTGCVEVTATTTEDHDLVVGRWADGRVGTVRGNRKNNGQFGAVLHGEKGSVFVDVYAHAKPYYASMLERILETFKTGKPAIDPEETIEIIRFIEAANESRETGKTVSL